MIRRVVSAYDRYGDWLTSVDRVVFWTWFALFFAIGAGGYYLMEVR